jgi:hypothetical protein
LLPGSPAIDAGDSTLAVDAHGNPLTTDQRGFPRSSGGKVDLGAVEMQLSSFSLVVSTLADKYDDTSAGTSLREAIALADTESTPQTITFAPGLTGTITLTLGELKITNSMTIDGPGAKLLSISGNNANRVFEIDNGQSSVSDVSISGLSIINGIDPFSGGGIWTQGDLTLDSVVVSRNTATGSGGFQIQGGGGGIYNSGSLTLDSVVVSHNTATGTIGFDGGGGLLHGLPHYHRFDHFGQQRA